MAKPNQNYEPEFRQKVVRLVLEEGRTIKSIMKNTLSEKELFVTGYESSKKNALLIQKPIIQRNYMKKI